MLVALEASTVFKLRGLGIRPNPWRCHASPAWVKLPSFYDTVGSKKLECEGLLKVLGR